jgi:pterin-4a-carbinolamine dehydratase
MKKELSLLMESYFSNKELLVESKASTIPRELPIKVRDRSNWERKENPERLLAIFTIKSRNKFNNFIMDVLEYQTETGHDGRISIQYPKVKIEIWTHTLKQITNVDIEWTKKVTQIFEGYKDA